MSSSPKASPEDVLALCHGVGSTTDTVNHTELMLYRHCREGRGSTSALYFAGEMYTYRQIADAAASCARWLSSIGIEAGDCVILALPDCATFVATYFGVVAAGATAIVIDPALPAEELFYIAQLCKARLTIAHNEIVSRLVGLRSAPGMIGVIGTDLSWSRSFELGEAIYLQQNPDHVVRGSADGYSYGLLSSGSTGRPKLIVHRHQDILYGYFAFARSVVGLTAADRVISVAKMTTGYGLGCSLLMPFLAGASSVLIAGAPRAVVLTDAIAVHRCTLIFAQPRFLAEVVSDDAQAGRLQSLRLAITGGEPLGSGLSNRWARFSRAELLDSYGSTEVGFLYISNRPGAARRGSVGKPVEGLQIELVDENGKVVTSNRIGKLRARGPMIIKGYWNDPIRTEHSFQNGWFVTSDLFSCDNDGFYYIHGRSDHLIKLGCGDWVNPNEIEMVLLEHPYVRECAVVGAPDATGLTILKAMIVSESARAPSRELALEIGSMIRDRWPLQEYKRIVVVEFTSELPKTTAGKLDRAKLQPQSMTEFSYKC